MISEFNINSVLGKFIKSSGICVDKTVIEHLFNIYAKYVSTFCANCK